MSTVYTQSFYNIWQNKCFIILWYSLLCPVWFLQLILLCLLWWKLTRTLTIHCHFDKKEKPHTFWWNNSSLRKVYIFNSISHCGILYILKEKKLIGMLHFRNNYMLMFVFQTVSPTLDPLLTPLHLEQDGWHMQTKGWGGNSENSILKCQSIVMYL